MADVQIAVAADQAVQVAVIDSKQTQLVLAAPPAEASVNVAVPGIQGPVGQGFPQGGTTGQILVKQSSTDYDITWTSIGAVISDGTY
jgi:hypothetical protein